jgi:hypothetical protein
MRVKKTAAQMRALREELIAKDAQEERQRIGSAEGKDAEERLRADLAEYTRERDSAFEALNKDQAEYDKQLLTLSAGFLALSLAFIKDVVPLKDAICLWTLYSAWGLLLSCICFVLASFQYSIEGHFGVARYWELRGHARMAEAERRQEIDQNIDQLWTQLDARATWGRRWNKASGVLFAIGVLFLVGFVILNVHRQAHPIPESNRLTRSDPVKPEPSQGRTSKVPPSPQANPKP